MHMNAEKKVWDCNWKQRMNIIKLIYVYRMDTSFNEFQVFYRVYIYAIEISIVWIISTKLTPQ